MDGKDAPSVFLVGIFRFMLSYYDSASLVIHGRTLCASTHLAPAAWKAFCNANIACDAFCFTVSLCIERIFGLRTSHAALQRQWLLVKFVCVMHDPGAAWLRVCRESRCAWWSGACTSRCAEDSSRFCASRMTHTFWYSVAF